jgi:hypothetical protein
MFTPPARLIFHVIKIGRSAFKAVFHCGRFARAGGAGFENLLTRA